LGQVRAAFADDGSLGQMAVVPNGVRQSLRGL
jgi:hypothetical protein